MKTSRPSVTSRPIRVHLDIYEEIRQAAFDARVKMPEIVRRAWVAYKLQHHPRKPKP